MAQNALGNILLTLLRGCAYAYGFQSSRLRAFWGECLGLGLRGAGFRREVIDRNLGIAFPGEAQLSLRSKLVGGCYRHLGMLFLDVLLVLGPFRRHCERNGMIRGFENWQSARAQGRGILLLASHVGNWEIMAATGALNGIDGLLVTKHLKPEWLHRAIEAGRLTCGVKGTYEPRTLRDVLAHLKRNGTVGFVLDQFTGAPVGVRVPFFGVPVGTHTALATLAKRTGAPVLPVVNFRTADGRQIIEIGKPVPWESHPNPAEELARNTARYVGIIEADVRAHPDQWLWTHQRFKGDLSPLKPGEWAEGRLRS